MATNLTPATMAPKRYFAKNSITGKFWTCNAAFDGTDVSGYPFAVGLSETEVLFLSHVYQNVEVVLIRDHIPPQAL